MTRHCMITETDFDPNTNLDQQERLLAALALEIGPTADDLRLRLAVARADLRQWLDEGGYEPKWERCPIAAPYWHRRTR